MNIVIPMAGRGERFRIEGYKNPKPLIEFNNKTMIELALESLSLKGDYIFIVYNYLDDKLNQKLKSILENYSDKIISIDYITEGPASSALLAEKYINNEQPLLITNCDQIMNWNSLNFKNFIETTELDGVVVTYNSETLKNSYVKLNDSGLAIKFAEKEVISKYSLNGIHYWKKGRYFVESAKSMIEKNIRCNNEFYLSLSYNQMIELGLNVGIFHIDNENHYAVGTPDDLENFISKNK